MGRLMSTLIYKDFVWTQPATIDTSGFVSLLVFVALGTILRLGTRGGWAPLLPHPEHPMQFLIMYKAGVVIGENRFALRFTAPLTFTVFNF